MFLQDENWGENTTAITGNTSVQSGSMEDMGALWPDTEQKSAFPILCHRYIATTLTGLLSLVAFISPLAMLVLPKLGNLILAYLTLFKYFQVLDQILSL